MRDPSAPPASTAPTDPVTPRPPGASWPQRFARWLLGAALLLAGLSHLTVGREEFLAQVPPWLPLDGDIVVVASGIVEIALGLALLALGRWRVPVGWLVALFFLAIFPGNIAQFTEGRDGFGLTNDVARGIRLLFQPLLVAWALWSTGAWAAYRSWRAGRRRDPSGTMRG
ncbi:MAG: DoxX family membrane protein [Actinobacteria bacterium]|nr:DoxX family membrane protein [Actinomycetota bacterium]MBU1609196.1 DoxX family membrane protein [Actinomycetota bacterium]MBU2316799.1 DoxX family membrane protein [Actinomycetota bacterium]MBU2386091.1 DoxX family membrane protein [Actinomycetota bacterium]